jgi:regulatory protein
MMERVITAIKVQKRNPQRVNIDLDGEFAFGLSRLVAAWLKPGDQLSEEKINSLIEKDALEVAYQRALDLFSHRPRSEKEVRQRLTEKAFQPDQIDQVVEKLKQANLVRDESFARMWVESRNEFHPAEGDYYATNYEPKVSLSHTSILRWRKYLAKRSWHLRLLFNTPVD